MISDATIDNLVRKIAKRKGFNTTFHITTNPSPTNSTIRHISIEGLRRSIIKTNDDGTTTTVPAIDYATHLFCRTADDSTNAQTRANFDRERSAHQLLLPALQPFISERTPLRYPKQHHTDSATAKQRLLMLSDCRLRPQPEQPNASSAAAAAAAPAAVPQLNRKQTQLALGELARLHAASLVMRVRQPEQHAQIATELRRLNDDDEGQPVAQRWLASLRADGQRWFECYERAWGTLNEDETGLQEEVEALRDSCVERLERCLDESAGGVVVFGHGNYTAKNVWFGASVLHQHKAKATDPTKPTVTITGWNSIHLTKPSLDILHLIFSSVHTKVRSQKPGMESLFRTYHNALDAALQEFGLQAETVLPWAQLLAELQENAPYGLLVAPWLLAKWYPEECDEYCQRMGDAIRDYIAHGFEV